MERCTLQSILKYSKMQFLKHVEMSHLNNPVHANMCQEQHNLGVDAEGTNVTSGSYFDVMFEFA
jgi:hypothetical protein